jgi:hypothetical protein
MDLKKERRGKREYRKTIPSGRGQPEKDALN